METANGLGVENCTEAQWSLIDRWITCFEVMAWCCLSEHKGRAAACTGQLQPLYLRSHGCCFLFIFWIPLMLFQLFQLVYQFLLLRSSFFIHSSSRQHLGSLSPLKGEWKIPACRVSSESASTIKLHTSSNHSTPSFLATSGYFVENCYIIHYVPPAYENIIHLIW